MTNRDLAAQFKEQLRRLRAAKAPAGHVAHIAVWDHPGVNERLKPTLCGLRVGVGSLHKIGGQAPICAECIRIMDSAEGNSP